MPRLPRQLPDGGLSRPPVPRCPKVPVVSDDRETGTVRTVGTGCAGWEAFRVRPMPGRLPVEPSGPSFRGDRRRPSLPTGLARPGGSRRARRRSIPADILPNGGLAGHVLRAGEERPRGARNVPGGSAMSHVLVVAGIAIRDGRLLLLRRPED